MVEGCGPCAERQAALTAWAQGHGQLLAIALGVIALLVLIPSIRHAIA